MRRARESLRIVAVGRHGDGAARAFAWSRPPSTALRSNSRSNIAGESIAVRLPLVGEFQIENALVAAGLAIGTGSEPDGGVRRARTSRRRQGPARAGRRAQRRADIRRLCAQARCAGQGAAGAAALRQAQAGGGVRRRRRPRCRQASADGRDRRGECRQVIVTDDNPRSENPEAIRAAILAAAKGASEIGDRAEAIRTAIAALQPGDALLIAGKGHETGQIVGDTTLPFSDHDAVAAALAPRVHERGAVVDRCRSGRGAGPVGEEFPDSAIDFVTQDSRAGEAGKPVRGLSGTPSGGHEFCQRRDGWEFAAKAEAAGAVAMIVPQDRWRAVRNWWSRTR